MTLKQFLPEDLSQFHKVCVLWEHGDGTKRRMMTWICFPSNRNMPSLSPSLLLVSMASVAVSRLSKKFTNIHNMFPSTLLEVKQLREKADVSSSPKKI